MLENIYWGLTITVFFWLAWKITKRITIPVNFFEVTGGRQTVMEGYIRRVNQLLFKPGKAHPLFSGYNDFYVTVQKGKVKYHSRYVLDTITPIIRDTDDILFFRIQAYVSGGKVTRFTQTSLSSMPNVTLLWRTNKE